MREVTACFSGHRPEKLPDNGSEDSILVGQIKSMLHLQIYEAIERGYKRFITGMAKGVDIWAAEMVLELAQGERDIKLICAIPYKGHGRALSGGEKYRYNSIIDDASEVIVLSNSYTSGCMKARNEYMVDNSSLLIAVCADYKSGTGQTIRYAKRQGIDTRIIRLTENT